VGIGPFSDLLELLQAVGAVPETVRRKRVLERVVVTPFLVAAGSELLDCVAA